ncbi:MAG: AAA family ATPase, partial [Planctomycetaceae bacterium]|nr:AAA family ATPase [Planctomycetaceae bacterium]
MTDKPQLLVVGGPNGSGKTTVAMQYADAEGMGYIGADAIAASLNPDDPTAARIEAGKHFIRSFNSAIANRLSCVVESTLSGRSFRNHIIEACKCGYEVTIVFVFVDSVDACVARVAERVRKGGHDVPEADIRRRYHRSIRNFWTLYRELADSWVVLYNGGSGIQDVSVGSGPELTVRDATLHATFLTRVESSN